MPTVFSVNIRMAFRSVFCLALTLAAHTVFSQPKSDSALPHISPFTSDGCSAFPDGSFENNNLWLNCCIQHDLAYWRGGTEQQREIADAALGECVKGLGENIIGELMHTGVRLGGTPYLPTSYRWGYGWHYLRGYAPLTDEESAQVTHQLEKLRALLLSTQKNWKNQN